VLFNLFVIAEPLICFPTNHGTPLTKIEKTRITCKKITYVVIRHFNKLKQLLLKLESKKFNDSVVRAFLECSLAATASTFRIWSSGKKNP